MSLPIRAVTVTVNTVIDIDDLDAGPDHSIDIQVAPGLPESVALSIALGAAKSLVNAIQDKRGEPHTFKNIQDDDTNEGIV